MIYDLFLIIYGFTSMIGSEVLWSFYLVYIVLWRWVYSSSCFVVVEVHKTFSILRIFTGVDEFLAELLTESDVLLRDFNEVRVTTGNCFFPCEHKFKSCLKKSGSSAINCMNELGRWNEGISGIRVAVMNIMLGKDELNHFISFEFEAAN